MEMGDYEKLKSLSQAATWMALLVTKLKLLSDQLMNLTSCSGPPQVGKLVDDRTLKCLGGRAGRIQGERALLFLVSKNKLEPLLLTHLVH
jgi:hypothetical protein